MKNRVDSTVFAFCAICGSQLRLVEQMCPCCGAETIEVNQLTLSKHARERHAGPHGREEDAEDPFYLM